MQPTRVLGYGACTPLGSTWTETQRALRNGRTAGREESVHGQPTRLSRVDEPVEGSPRFHHLALAALEDLRKRGNLDAEEPAGLVACTSKGALGKADESILTGPANPGIWAGRLADELPAVKRVSSPNTACATGLTGLVQGARWIADGELEHVVVVASESCFHPLLLAGYRQLGVLCDADGMRPFHPDRSGFALGEAAAAVHLASPDFAESRDRDARGSIAGWGETCDAHHMTQMDEEAAQVREAIDRALDVAELTREDVDLLHAHLTTTKTNDALERNLLADWPGRACLQAVKPSLGHTIGAAGLLEVIATLDVLVGGEPFPLPTVRDEDFPDESLHPDNADTTAPRWGVSWNMGFGGHNAAVVLGGDEVR